MLIIIFDFFVGFFVARSAVNSGRTARNTAALVEMAALTEAQKIERAKRAESLAGERRFVYIVFGVILAGRCGPWARCSAATENSFHVEGFVATL